MHELCTSLKFCRLVKSSGDAKTYSLIEIRALLRFQTSLYEKRRKTRRREKKLFEKIRDFPFVTYFTIITHKSIHRVFNDPQGRAA